MSYTAHTQEQHMPGKNACLSSFSIGSMVYSGTTAQFCTMATKSIEVGTIADTLSAKSPELETIALASEQRSPIQKYIHTLTDNTDNTLDSEPLPPSATIDDACCSIITEQRSFFEYLLLSLWALLKREFLCDWRRRDLFWSTIQLLILSLVIGIAFVNVGKQFLAVNSASLIGLYSESFSILGFQILQHSLSLQGLSQQMRQDFAYSLVPLPLSCLTLLLYGIARALILSVIYSVPLFLLSIHPSNFSASDFFAYCGLVALYATVVHSLTTLFVVSAGNEAASSIGAVVLILQGMVAGFYVLLQKLPPFYKQVSYGM